MCVSLVIGFHLIFLSKFVKNCITQTNSTLSSKNVNFTEADIDEEDAMFQYLLYEGKVIAPLE